MSRKMCGKILAFIGTLGCSGMWLLFVIDYWNHAGEYAGRFPQTMYAFLRYSNAAYLISAGLPMLAFLLTVVIPGFLKRVFPGYRVWNQWYTIAVTVLLAAQTVLMLCATNFFVDTGIAKLLFGYSYLSALKMLAGYYVYTIPIALCLSIAISIAGTGIELTRMSVAERSRMFKRTLVLLLVCIAIALINAIGSILLLNLLSALGFRSAAVSVYAFCAHNASNKKAAVISVLCAPLAEEIAFRGLICRGLGKTSQRWAAIVISAVFFGLWHRNLGQFVYTFMWGIVYGYIYLKTDKVIWPMLVHFLSNILAILAHSHSDASVFGAWPVLCDLKQAIVELPVFASILSLGIAVFLLVLCLYGINKNVGGEMCDTKRNAASGSGKTGAD